MVSINHTYDESVHNVYQHNRLFIATQNIRKSMGIRPWNKITIILDVNYVMPLDELYGMGFVRDNLRESVSNADVEVGDFNGDEFYESLDGLHETDIHKVYATNFSWELFDTYPKKTDPKLLTGKIVVHFKNFST